MSRAAHNERSALGALLAQRSKLYKVCTDKGLARSRSNLQFSSKHSTLVHLRLDYLCANNLYLE